MDSKKAKFSFYIPEELVARVRAACFSVPRSDPRHVSINGFVALAIEEALRRQAPRRKR